MTDQALKPCPFCGSVPEIESSLTRIDFGRRLRIECIECGSAGPAVRVNRARRNNDARAIDEWNKRACKPKELAALLAFAQAVMDCWPDGWGIEGDDLQHIATEHGMLIPEIRTDPCGDACRCAERVLPKEWIDGVVCYRKTALLTGSKQ